MEIKILDEHILYSRGISTKKANISDIRSSIKITLFILIYDWAFIELVPFLYLNIMLIYLYFLLQIHQFHLASQVRKVKNQTSVID